MIAEAAAVTVVVVVVQVDTPYDSTPSSHIPYHHHHYHYHHQLDAVVTWRPGPGLKNEDILNLSVPGGKETELKVVGMCSEAKIGILEKKVDLGMIAVGVTLEQVWFSDREES